jgi:MinD-like ATPase involved in chromosome partitioning or flagellar assembly
MLDNREGNVKMLIRGIRQQDNGVGFAYLCRPDNYDDMYILSAENMAVLIESCAEVTDELVIDMSCVCDRRTRRVFELADRVLLVTDPTSTAQTKLSQFTFQHNVFERISAKATLVANKGAEAGKPPISAVIRLPLVQSANASAVYRTLSASSFEA